MSRSNTQTLGRSLSRTPTDPELIDRLARLRTILPLIASDLASARRRAHALELDNQRLTRRIAELESTLAGTTILGSRTTPEMPDRSLAQPGPTSR